MDEKQCGNVLKTHDVHLETGPLILRPMSEADWDILQSWQTDPEVLYYTEGDNITSRTLEETQDIWRTVSRSAFVFIVKLDGRPIGECWLQRMNLKEILDRYPNRDLRRIDMSIGDKSLWGKGWGAVMIALLVKFAFDVEHADAVFGAGVADYNPRSRLVFEKNCFVIDQIVPQDPGNKAAHVYNLILTRERYRELGLSPQQFLAAARL